MRILFSIKKKLKALLVFSFFVCISGCVSKSLVPNVDWYFLPNGSLEKFFVKSGHNLSVQIPRNVNCCSGKFIATLNSSELNNFIDSNMVPALFFPPISGLKSITINNEKLHFMNGDFNSVGPILQIDREHLKSETILLQIEIDYPRTSYAGMWLASMQIGDLSALISKRDWNVVSQKYIPLMYSAFFSIVLLILFWIGIKTKLESKLLNAHMAALLAWSIFFLFLSGEVRLIWPKLGSNFHIAIRCVAGLMSIRLFAVILHINVNIIQKLIIILLFSIGASVVANSFWNTRLFEACVYTLVNSIFVYFVFRLTKKSKNPPEKWMAFSGWIAGVGFMFDSAKLLSVALVFDYPLPYFNRFTIPLLLMTSLVYLADELKNQMNSNAKRKAVEQVVNQVVHDLKSPLGALNVISSSNDIPPELRKIVSGTRHKIVKMCQDLASSSVAAVIHRYCVNDLIKELLNEKRLEMAAKCRVVFKLIDPKEQYFVNLDAVEFQRILSNIINNSVEAIVGNGSVSISIEKSEQKIIVDVLDDGRGVPNEHIGKLGEYGFTLNKSAGSGLGLYHAKSYVAACGGNLSIESKYGAWTKVRIILPSSK